MNQVDLVEAIAARLAQRWPQRIIYRDFCPSGHQRPSFFLYVTKAEFQDVLAGLVRWTFEAELELHGARDEYDASSTEELRQDQAEVLALFGGPGIQVGDRHVSLTAEAEAPGPGVAYVLFRSQWLDSRPGWQEPGAEAPMMEHIQINNQAGRSPAEHKEE